LLSREGQHALGERGTPLRASKRTFDQALTPQVIWQSLSEEIEIRHHGHQEIVEIVSDATGQLAYALHFLRLLQLILRLFAGRNLGYQFRRAFMHTLFESSRQLGKSRPLGRQLLQARSRLILSPTAAERRSDDTG
jgi:hypothetical protein